MATRTAIALLAIAGFTIAACGSDDSSTSDSVTAADLSNREFVSSDVTGHELVDGSDINMHFLDDAVSVNAGCNTMNGHFEIADGTFTAEQLAMTMMAFLASSPAIALDGSTLTFTGDDATITLEEIEPAALMGSTRVVTGCNTGSGDVEVGDDTLTFGPIVTTLRACVDEVAQLEANVLEVLQGEVDYEISADTLSLRSGEIGLEFAAQP